MPPVERFLSEFHDARPGLTPKAFAELPILFQGRAQSSTYEVLAAVVPSTGRHLEVLDLACGDGFLLSILASRSQTGLSLSGVDMSSAELAAARARLDRTVPLMQARAQALPCASGSFDYVLCHLALMLMVDVERVLGEVRRVLKPGAMFAAIVDATMPASVALSAYTDALSRRARQAHWSEVRFGDRRFRSREGIAELLSVAFENVLMEEIHSTRRLSANELWLWFLDMYDLYLLSQEDRRAVEQEYRAAVVSACGADGKLEFPQTFRYISATAA
jgi:ubiquinone/menaquinone biosynthesis C-methylase UbiE